MQVLGGPEAFEVDVKVLMVRLEIDFGSCAVNDLDFAPRATLRIPTENFIKCNQSTFRMSKYRVTG
jgi:hypothetical protein